MYFRLCVQSPRCERDGSRSEAVSHIRPDDPSNGVLAHYA